MCPGFFEEGSVVVLKNLLIILILLLNACAEKKHHKHVIADIPEASGICYDPTSNALFVVGDEGDIYELSPDGTIKRKKHLGDYDLEGIACDTKRNRLLAVAEGKEALLIIDKRSLTVVRNIRVNRTWQGKRLLKKDKKHGFEGITIDPEGSVYISNQSMHIYPHTDPSVIVKIRDLSHKKVMIDGIIDPGKKDISGLAWHDGYLYMVSDTNNKLYRYNPAKKEIDWQQKLPRFTQEGITFGPDKKIFFSDDNGHIRMYSSRRLHLR